MRMQPLKQALLGSDDLSHSELQWPPSERTSLSDGFERHACGNSCKCSRMACCCLWRLAAGS